MRQNISIVTYIYERELENIGRVVVIGVCVPGDVSSVIYSRTRRIRIGL